MTRLAASATGGHGGAGDVPAADANPARRALLQVAAAVTVLTVGRNGLSHGTTVSAMSTMSRNPLILGVCLRPSSKFAAMIRPATLFSVNVLSVRQADVARRFADPLRPAGDGQFAGLDRTTDALTGAPLIGGCLAHLACRATERLRVGDHELLLAEVLLGTPGEGEPLVSFAGRLEGVKPDNGEPSTANAEPPTTTEGP
ncbi:flavin reductase family protein [Spirillospora sp. NPDC048819]|uniref:flavin reductase family protein n=1 Tax=Spirillospora sp. NPDC048819 TaxID=3155268 RepID=UPI0033E4A12E